ncbi:MAG: hypothetical protein ABIE55_04270 [Candidatus Aenigmatarchaeota archaeon]
MILKILGLLMIIVGFLILKYFPDMERYQRGGFTMSGILIGLVMLLVGIGLIIFG